MGVTNEYFIAPTDADAAMALEDGPAAGVIGPDPNTELIALEAILLGLDPDGPEAVALVARPDHALDVAHDGDYDRVVIRIAAATTQLIGNKTLDELRARIPQWAQTDEMPGASTTDIDSVACRPAPAVRHRRLRTRQAAVRVDQPLITVAAQRNAGSRARTS